MKSRVKLYKCSRCHRPGADTVKCRHCGRNFCEKHYTAHVHRICDNAFAMLETFGKALQEMFPQQPV